MNKKITGVPEDKEDARDQLVDSRNRFRIYLEHLQFKKQEYQQIKKANDREREDIMKQQRLAEQFKFTKMTKKSSFLPALKSSGNFHEINSVHAIGVQYMDYRDKIRLCMPDKTFVKESKQWKLQKTCDGDLFQRTARQEFDVYDADMLKYMRTWDRGLEKPQTFKGRSFSIKQQLQSNQQLSIQQDNGAYQQQQSQSDLKERYLATNSKKWDPNNFFPKLLGTINVDPLLDNTNTPRGVKKAITLDRCFDKQPWIYNRTESSNFQDHYGSSIFGDKKKSLVLKKKLRQQRKESIKKQII